MLSIIIGKRSNLSNHLLNSLDEAITISSLKAVDDMSKAILLSRNINLINVASGKENLVRIILDYLLERDIKISTENVERDEISISIANNTILKTILAPDYRFKNVKDFVMSELLA